METEYLDADLIDAFNRGAFAASYGKREDNPYPRSTPDDLGGAFELGFEVAAEELSKAP